MQWVVGGTDAPRRVQARAPLPTYVSDAPADRSLTELLQDGDIDALFAPIPPRAYDATNGPIVRLVADYPVVEKRYFSDTGCYPTQHLLLIRRETWERDPTLGARLLEIFHDCETRFQAGQHLFPYGSPWQIAEIEEADRVMGPDYHAHGLENNRRELDLFCQSAFEDGLTSRRVSVDEYFAEFLEESGR